MGCIEDNPSCCPESGDLAELRIVLDGCSCRGLKWSHHFTVLHCTALHYIKLHCTALHCTALYCTALHYMKLHCTTLNCSALPFIKLNCTALHYTALHWCIGKISSRKFFPQWKIFPCMHKGEFS